MTQATIAAVQVTAFRYPIQNCATERTSGHTFDCTGATSSRARLHVTIRATDGSCGTYVGGTDVMLPQVEKAAQLLIGMPWHAREPFYATARRLLQKHDRMGVGLLDSALWDLAGKRAGMSVAEMLGGARASAPVHVTCGFPALDTQALVEACGAEVAAGARGARARGRAQQVRHAVPAERAVPAGNQAVPPRRGARRRARSVCYC